MQFSPHLWKKYRKFYFTTGRSKGSYLCEARYLLFTCSSNFEPSFYRLTTEFANYLKEDETFDYNIQVTGHSLGGGLAMITGAQAELPSIGVSGPNAMISGRSFDPPVLPEQLNRYTFNIIPNRDIVPMLDDPADQIQNIRCEAAPNNFAACHFAKVSRHETDFCDFFFRVSS